MKVFRLTGVAVVRVDGNLIIQATGLSATAGWTEIALSTDDPNPGDRVLEFALDGTPPAGVSLQVLTPVSASVVVPGDKVDGVLVKARTNSIEVHASEFQSTGSLPADPPVSTRAIGEETPFPLPTTERFGEEGPPFTTLRFGEEDPSRFIGENLPTLLIGEGPLGTDVRIDDPAAFNGGGGLTTLALGEEGGPIDPRLMGRGTPFGGF